MQQTNEKSLMTKFTRCLFLLMFMVCASAAYAQGLKVSGTVVDDMGEPVIGASVTVQGTTNGCVTDIDGKYTLTKVAKNATLVFTYMFERHHEGRPEDPRRIGSCRLWFDEEE